ncbi:signal peptidase II [Paracoccus benzoatiresistens]|uniref:Lipoprotein signal peptidase n=1 Tax=Paracoccus benzoatiresistens TaxID=2997341 RepID=A0ABT4J0J0_9RHOB|nr:signal peptidase II [Paracoccus sp. EF6]MCZ0960147.1 signal peptidase II [Paracoccus sp. EF6]
MQHELPLDQPPPQPAPQQPGPRPRRSRAPKRPAPPARTNMRLVAWTAGLIFLLDQVLKYWVVHVLRLDRVREIDVLPPWLNLRMAWNQGVNFGLMASETNVTRWILIAVAIAIVAWVWIWIWRANAGRFARIAAGLLIGGALGNVIDRLLYGAVADFLNMSLPGWQNPYSFNVADIAIFAGAIGLVLVPQKKEPPKAARKPRGRPADHSHDKTRDGAGKSG